MITPPITKYLFLGLSGHGGVPDSSTKSMCISTGRLAPEDLLSLIDLTGEAA
jgi:hypothetical protein